MTYQQRRVQWARDRDKDRFIAFVRAVCRSKHAPLDVKYTVRTWERWKMAERLLGYYNC